MIPKDFRRPRKTRNKKNQPATVPDKKIKTVWGLISLLLVFFGAFAVYMGIAPRNGANTSLYLIISGSLFAAVGLILLYETCVRDKKISILKAAHIDIDKYLNNLMKNW